ncbi:MAG: 16S rRNA (adenine(1518)-N(6)/adenine(1519)-N(6))-dimethyltransferase RsmA [Patescibacteria group bacterium]
MNKTELKNLLQQHHLKPNKRMGQNFLIDQNIAQKLIQTANISKQDIVLEIGPGLGILTKKLAGEARKVIAVEKDKKLAEILKEILKDWDNIEIIQGDILKIQGLRYGLIVANLPYYLTAPAIRMFLESAHPPQSINLLIQKEMAQRICARPPRLRPSGYGGQARMNLLAVSVQFYSRPKIIHYVSKTCFWPQPKVDSAIIQITNIQKPKGVNIKKFFQIVKAGFSSPRKQLINNLSNKLDIPRERIKTALTQCNLLHQARAENLSLEDWKLLTRGVSES